MRKRMLFPALLLTASLLLTSCALFEIEWTPDSSDTPKNTTQAGGTTAAPYVPPERPDASAAADAALEALPELYFDGATFLVATAADNMLFPTVSAEAGAEILPEHAARLERNAKVSRRYAVNFIPASTTVDAMYNDALAAQNSGLYYADLLVLPGNQTGRFMLAGLLRNLSQLPFWEVSGSAEAAAGVTAYADLNEALLDHDRLPVVFFNRTLAQQLGFDFYADVEAGTWTWERYLEASVAAASIDGTWGHALNPSDRGDYLSLCAVSCGYDPIDRTLGRTPQIAVNETLTNLVGQLVRRLAAGEGAFPAQANNPIAGLQVFTEGKILFCCGSAGYMDWIFPSQAEWGILPMPKADESGGYRTPVGAAAPVLAVTANNTKFEMTGILLAALDAASTDVITEAYINHRLIHRLRDNKSAAMLELAFDSAVYSFSEIYGGAMPGLDYAVNTALKDVTTSASSLSQIITWRSWSANQELTKWFGMN